MTANLPQFQQQYAVNWKDELSGAQMLLKSGLIPKDIKTPEAALFCILAGRDLGLSAVQSLRSIRPIQGKLELSADAQLGLFTRDGGKIRWIKLDSTGAELELMAPWMTAAHVSKFGTEEAKKADLMSNAMYRKYPAQMFRSRAITSGLKDIGFLAGAGIYAPGEISGTATVDLASGEVLPAEVDITPSKSVELKDGSGTTGSVEALEDEAREALMEIANHLTDRVRMDDMPAAMMVWKAQENDDKVALWAMMDKDVKKAIKKADADAKAAEAIALDDSDAPAAESSATKATTGSSGSSGSEKTENQGEVL